MPIHRGREVVGFAQDASGVDVHLADGGRSTIRKAAGIEFPGWDATRSTLIAEVQATEDTPTGVRIDETGMHGLSPNDDGRTFQVLVTEQQLGPSTEPTLADLSKALIAVYDTDSGVRDPTSISRFSDATRQAAVNLGWKLAQVIKEIAPDSLLDTYQAERHPATARVLKYTMAMSATQRADARVKALTDVMADLLSVDVARANLAGLHLGLDVYYEAHGGHPLVGRRMPDLDLVTAAAALRVFTLLHDARPALLNLGEPGSIALGPWGDRCWSTPRTTGPGSCRSSVSSNLHKPY